MHRALLLLPLLAGCSIRDVSFIGPGVGGDGGGDGGSGDGPGTGGPMRKLYVLDATRGIYRFDKNPTTGMLTLASSNPTALPSSLNGGEIVTSRDGTRLYVSQFDVTTPNNGQVTGYQISATGDLTRINTIPQLPCNPMGLSLHPQGNFLVIGCNRAIAVFSLGADGALSTPSLFQTPATSSIQALLGPNATCLFAGDGSTAGVGVMPYVVDTTGTPNSLSLSPVAGVRKMVVSPTGTALFLATPNPGGAVSVGAIQMTCAVGTINAMPTAPLGGNTYELLFDPSGQYLIAAGADVRSFSVSGTSVTPVSGSPFLTGATFYDAKMDPAVPDKLYLLHAGTVGVEIASFNAGVITPISGSIAATGGNSQRFTFAP